MLVDTDYIHHVVDEHAFEDGYLFFRFRKDGGVCVCVCMHVCVCMCHRVCVCNCYILGSHFTDPLQVLSFPSQ